MNENNNEPVRFYDLPKDERKALQKEFFQTEEGKKANRMAIIMVSLFAAITITLFVITLNERQPNSYVYTPTFFICVFPAIITSNKMQKWLLDTKNITMEKKKREKKQK